MNKFIPLLLLVSFFFSCGSPSLRGKSEKNLNDLKWFLGRWEGTSQEMMIQEIWNEENKTLFNGDGFVCSEKDTLFHESLKIKIENSTIFYVAKTPGNPGPVSFKLTFLENNKAVFENSEHDFPKVITYTLLPPDSLTVIAEGDEDGKHRKEEFHFKKAN